MPISQPKMVSLPLMLLGIVFCVSLITSNLLETKILQIGPVALTAGFLVFPVSYILNDCIAEVWGFRKARLIIWLGFAMNFFVVAMGNLAVALPAAPGWEGAEHFNFVFALAPRIACASLLAFVVGSFLNAWVMSRMKLAHQGRHFSLRAVCSTLVGETADSLIFFPIAFFGLLSLPDMVRLMIVQIAGKTLYEVIVLPVTVQVVRLLKRWEGSEAFDDGVSYSFWRIGDL